MPGRYLVEQTTENHGSVKVGDRRNFAHPQGKFPYWCEAVGVFYTAAEDDETGEITDTFDTVIWTIAPTVD